MKSPVFISVVICTLNRCEYLRMALESLARQTLSRDRYEVVVVDNGSSDSTADVARVLLGNLATGRYVHEPVIGHSRARNTGWRHATGEIVAYLDDDSIASQYWLSSIARVFETVHPLPGCVGGPVNLIWEQARPCWLADEILGYLATVKHSDMSTPLGQGQWLVGTNIAFPRTVLAAAGGFNERLGRKGRNLLSMDENHLQHEIRMQGHSLYYDPAILVWHHAHAHRLKQRWFRKRYYWEGRSQAVLENLTEPLTLSNWRAKLELAAATIRRRFLDAPTLVFKSDLQDSERMFMQCILYERFGYLHGLLLQTPQLRTRLYRTVRAIFSAAHRG